jgi:nitroimidazol reductase NimA-like FMN-containing flavoprotein (pyridoxamine 5'-phosphate oxidase superfamily)
VSDENIGEVMDILNQQLVAVLSTSSNDKSYSCLVSFVVTKGFQDVIFATKRERLKYRNMSENPNVSLLIDNRKNKPSDITEATSVTIVGSVEDIQTKDRVRLIRHLVEKHPNLKSFFEADDTAVMRLYPERMYVVDNFESVSVIRF